MPKINMRKIFTYLLSVIVVFTFVSCGNVGYTEEEIKQITEDLVEKSYGINEIYFGEGFETTNEVSISSSLYYAVSESAEYKSITEIKEATEKVYTEDYSQILYKIGFEGTSLDDDSEKVRYARFLDDFDGKLVQRNDLKETSVLQNRTYNFSTITVDKMKKKEAVVTLDSLIDGKKDVSVTITLKLCENGWRLDTPTY